MPAPSSFENTYAKLPPILFRPAQLQPVSAPRFILKNQKLAAEIGLPAEWFSSPQALQALAGNAPLPDVAAIAMAYAGHQFGHFVPSLGDGRASLLGEIVGSDGIRRDLHLKGSGRTAYSRGGDGRATLGAVLREYIVSQAMAAYGIPTTRALSVVATGQAVPRERMEQGAVLTRVAHSHVRVGTFQYLAARGENEAIKALADYELQRNFPGAPLGPERYEWFLAQVISRQASLIAKWMCVGFIHGVMNTDNMSVCGETIDYGPCAFMDAFNPQKTFSSIDHTGRYAWDKQPYIALWNLTRFAEALLSLFDADNTSAIKLAEAALGKFMPAFEQAFENGMAHKLGFQTCDASFIAETLQMMTDASVDFTNFFTALTTGENLQLPADWQVAWAAHGPPDKALMKMANPIFTPRNHRVEQAIAAANNGDLQPLHRLLKVLENPFTPDPENADLAAPPNADEEVLQTFCGT